MVTGGDGQLGRALKKCLSDYEHIIALGSDLCDVTYPEHVSNAFCTFSPDFVIHCAGYTAVDRAEIENEICRKINVYGTQNVADACRLADIPLMFLSTDYIFDDNGTVPHEVNERRKALNNYGKSKIDAEDIVMKLSKYYIVRTSWVFGDGRNFVKTIYNLAQTASVINVVDDQIGSPTYSEDLAIAIYELIKKAPFGIYHITNEGICSWAELAEKVIELTHLNVRIKRVSTDEYPSTARRPLNSRLSKKILDEYNVSRLETWENALIRYINTWE